MCDDCPTCPKCGQEIPQPPTAGYLVGLLAPPVGMAAAFTIAFAHDFLEPRLYWFLFGMMMMGAVLLVRTDPHYLARRSVVFGEDTHGRVQFVDVILAFATLVTFAAMAPWVYKAIGMGQGVVDPLSGVLLELMLPLFVIGMLVSIGVSARTG